MFLLITVESSSQVKKKFQNKESKSLYVFLDFHSDLRNMENGVTCVPIFYPEKLFARSLEDGNPIHNVGTY